MLDAQWIVQIYSKDTDGVLCIGTGYLINDKLILTARHVVFSNKGVSSELKLVFPERDNDGKLKKQGENYIYDFDNAISFKSEDIMFQGNEQLDVAVICCPKILQPVPPMVKLATVNSLSDTQWKTRGFPKAGKVADFQREQLGFAVNLQGMKNESIFELHTTVNLDKNLFKSENGWGGLSGAPVFADNQLIAVITDKYETLDSYFFAVSIPYLLEKEQKFADLVGEKKSAENKTAPLFEEGDLIPYLANRVDQELELCKEVKVYQAVQSPFICVIHGKQEECSEGFIKRIHFCSLKKAIPKQVQQGIKRYIFSCDSFKNEEELHEKMWASLGEVVVGYFAEPDEIAQVIAQQNCPVLLCVAMSSDDCLHNKGIQSIDFFLNFWKKWSSSTEQRHLLLVCFSFNYTNVNSVFGLFSGTNKINKMISNYLNQQLDFTKFNLSGVVLSELTPIEQKQVEDWARTYAYQSYEKLHPLIKNLFTSNKKISMESLALKLEEMYEAVK